MPSEIISYKQSNECSHQSIFYLKLLLFPNSISKTARLTE